LVVQRVSPAATITEKRDGVYLEINCGDALQKQPTALVSTETLGKARVPGLGYENPDGSPLIIDADYFGKRRNPDHPTPGPFEHPGSGKREIRVW
jgi:alpha-N-arabinofuranosidase